MLSSSHLFYGLSGLTVAAGGITTGGLIKKDNRISEDKKVQEIIKKVGEECGESIGGGGSEMDDTYVKPDQPNSRGNDKNKFEECEKKILKKYDTQ